MHILNENDNCIYITTDKEANKLKIFSCNKKRRRPYAYKNKFRFYLLLLYYIGKKSSQLRTSASYVTRENKTRKTKEIFREDSSI